MSDLTSEPTKTTIPREKRAKYMRDYRAKKAALNGLSIGDAMNFAAEFKRLSDKLDSLQVDAQKTPQSVSELRGELLKAFKWQTSRIEALDAKVKELSNLVNQDRLPPVALPVVQPPLVEPSVSVPPVVADTPVAPPYGSGALLPAAARSFLGVTGARTQPPI